MHMNHTDGHGALFFTVNIKTNTRSYTLVAEGSKRHVLSMWQPYVLSPCCLVKLLLLLVLFLLLLSLQVLLLPVLPVLPVQPVLPPRTRFKTALAQIRPITTPFTRKVQLRSLCISVFCTDSVQPFCQQP